MQPSNIYFYGPIKYPEEYGSPAPYYFIFTAKDEYDSGECFCCAGRDSEKFFDMIDAIGGAESMEGIWEFNGQDGEEVKQLALKAGFVFNEKLKEHSLPDEE
jgi:hypothetical protein